MVSAEREPITGVWGRLAESQRGPGPEPLVRGQGPEAERLLHYHNLRSWQICPENPEKAPLAEQKKSSDV